MQHTIYSCVLNAKQWINEVFTFEVNKVRTPNVVTSEMEFIAINSLNATSIVQLGFNEVQDVKRLDKCVTETSIQGSVAQSIRYSPHVANGRLIFKYFKMAFFKVQDVQFCYFLRILYRINFEKCIICDIQLLFYPCL